MLKRQNQNREWSSIVLQVDTKRVRACIYELLGWEGPGYLGKHVSPRVWPP